MLDRGFETINSALAGGAVPWAMACCHPMPGCVPQRIGAAQTTAQSAAACVAIKPFYWEVGDARQALADGSVGPDAPNRATPMAIASASKWIYAGFVTERRAGNLTAEDVRFMTFRGGFARFRICRSSQTVASCADSRLNGSGEPDTSTAERFSYRGGHIGPFQSSSESGALRR